MPKHEDLDLEGLEKRLRGSGWVETCCHPDLSHRAIDDPARRCVLDDGKPDECDLSDPKYDGHITDKKECQFWGRLAREEPAPLTIDEGLRLIQRQRELEEALRPFAQEVPALWSDGDPFRAYFSNKAIRRARSLLPSPTEAGDG